MLSLRLSFRPGRLLALLGAAATLAQVQAVDFPGNGDAGFGGAMGNGTLTLTDDGVTVTGTITKGTSGDFNDNLVLYIDSVSGGFTDTAAFADADDDLRRAISGFDGGTNRSTLTFLAGFEPDYAIALGPASASYGGLWRLANGGGGSLPFITSVNLTPLGSNNSTTYTFSFPLSAIGLTPGDGGSFRLVGSYISNSAYRSTEALPGNVTGAEQGWVAFTQTVAVTYTTQIQPIVSNANDSGPGSLRQVLANAALTAGTDEVVFASTFAGPVDLASEIVVTSSASIDATSVPGGLTIRNGIGVNTRLFSVDAGQTLHLTGITLSGGKGIGATDNNNGGAIHNRGTVTLTRCTVSGNSAARGGAIFGETGSTLTIDESAVVQNAASIDGGGIFNRGALIFRRSTLAANTSVFDGAGIYTLPGSTNHFLHSTVAANAGTSPTGADGGGMNMRGALTLSYSIVAGNSAAFGPDIFRDGGAITTPTPNLIRDNSTTGLAAVPGLIGTSGAPVEPLLAPLDNYGGPTRTMALRPASPARNAGTDSTAALDQRGFPIVGTPDLGAYEAGTLTNFNAWVYETLLAAATDPQHAAGFDFDGDGATNFEEWIALTDPGIPGSRLAAAVSTDASGVVVSFPTASGRVYRLEQSDDLLGWIDAPGQSPLGGDGSVRNFTLPPQGVAKRHFRVRAAFP